VKDDSYWVAQMIDIIDRSQQIVRRGEPVFFDPGNQVEFWAARMVVLDLDVAAEKLSDGFRRKHPDVPWSALARARDKYAHHYEDIDRSVVWNLIAIRLPRLATALR
jgi:uncharacterized protein with HEPN domain